MDKIILDFRNERTGEQYDVEVSPEITARELIIGLNEAYKLEIDISHPDNVFFRTENPTALIKGHRKLHEYGLRQGSIVYYL